MTEINYTNQSVMRAGFPVIHKLGAVSPNGETSPFVFHDRLYRLELHDPSRGTDSTISTVALIRDRETGEILSRFGEGCYYYSLYQENDIVYVIGTKSQGDLLCGDTLLLYESRDLLNWSERILLSNPGWKFFNTSMTKGPGGYVLAVEASEPAAYVGVPFTAFFAVSEDMVHWTWMDYEKGYPKHRYLGGPWLHYSRGYYYLIAVTELPCQRYTNYIYRTKDFDTWEVGYYNPLLMPSEEDRSLSPYAVDFDDAFLEQMRTGFLASNSDMDMCDWQGKTLIVYNIGNQQGFYYLAEAAYEGSVDDFLEANFR